MRHVFRFPSILALSVIGQMAFASEGSHLSAEQLDAVVDRVVEAVAEPQVVEVEREVPVEVEVVREVEVAPVVRRAVAVTFAGDNADGCDIPAVTVAYEHESDNIDAHGRATTQGNLACDDATSADIQIRTSLDRFALTLGYDRRAVAVQEVIAGEGRVVRHGASVVETAAIGYALGSATVGWNVLQESPRIAVEHDFADSVTVEAEAQRYPGTGLVTSVRVSWTQELASGFAVTAHVGTTRGLDNVPDGIRWATPAPASPPSQSHSFGIGFARSF